MHSTLPRLDNGRNCFLATPVGEPRKFVCHSYRVVKLAMQHGWLPGARYTNLRDVRRFDRLGFLDIDWASYDFGRHLRAAEATRPMMTVAQDIQDIADLDKILDQARNLLRYCEQVIIVPKDIRMEDRLTELVPSEFVLGYSVPTRYGGTTLPLRSFKGPVHLLGGRPDAQARLANSIHVTSLDCNRFTLDAAFGDFFDGQIFRPHPVGGYERCLADSLVNINCLWRGGHHAAL